VSQGLENFIERAVDTVGQYATAPPQQQQQYIQQLQQQQQQQPQIPQGPYQAGPLQYQQAIQQGPSILQGLQGPVVLQGPSTVPYPQQQHHQQQQQQQQGPPQVVSVMQVQNGPAPVGQRVQYNPLTGGFELVGPYEGDVVYEQQEIGGRAKGDIETFNSFDQKTGDTDQSGAILNANNVNAANDP